MGKTAYITMFRIGLDSLRPTPVIVAVEVPDMDRDGNDISRETHFATEEEAMAALKLLRAVQP